MELTEFLRTSYTAYHAVHSAEEMLLQNGFERLHEGDEWHLKTNGRYFVTRASCSLVAFTMGKKNGFNIVASHTDSPCLKLKNNPEITSDGYTKLNVETYGGGIWYTFFDRPLKIAGRIIVKDENGALKQVLYTSEYTLVIPSVAVHQNRGVNEGFAPNAQADLLPLFALGEAKLDLPENALSYDLYLTPAQEPFVNGANGEFLSAPRIDNLTSVYASLCALTKTDGGQINVCACFDNEEVGSGTLQGADSDFLYSVLKRIALSRGLNEEGFSRALATSFLFSLDNAHAVHPNHGEKCDPTNRPLPGGGIVIKSHANKAYTTDALTSAIAQTVFEKAGAKYQTFYNRSDMRSGSTLGAISLSHVGVPSCDIGLAQLAMHSALETFALCDLNELLKGLTQFFRSEIIINGESVTVNG